MEPERQLHLANVLQGYRESLEGLLDEIHEREIPLAEIEVRLLKEVPVARLERVEDELRFDGHRRQRSLSSRAYARIPDRLKRMLSRLRGLVRPKIGVLYHHPPRPVCLSANYFETRPPMPAPTISLVTPSYAQGRFLERTLLSVLGQGYPELEYVVQDGGSSDGTLEILRRYEGQLTHWASEPDDGQADAINRGFRRTSGEIMGWLNSDDMLLPGALAYVAGYFAAHPDVDVVYGNRIMVDESDDQIGIWVLPRHDDRALTLADYVPQETLFWRRRMWDAAGGRVDPTFGYALDWDLLLRFRAAGASMVRLPRFLGAFRVHDEQKTSVDHALGARECDQLRIRVHGRPVGVDEIVRGLRPYLRRHVVAHARQRLNDLLPRSRKKAQIHSPGPRSPLLLEALNDELGNGQAPSGTQRMQRESSNQSSLP
jgi:GT2 family glycosyltransferase